MKRIVYITALILGPFLLEGQNPNGSYNPYVNEGMITPAPMWPAEFNGTGTVNFNIGNTGSDPLEVFTDQYITLTITLSYGEPDHADPMSAVGGTSAGLFSWRYDEGTYTATQTSDIPANSSGTITIAYKVKKNSSSPGLNGFNVNISPAPYQTDSNAQNDDAVSSYTYTEIRDYGDAPESYGTAWHVLDFENYLGSLADGEHANQPSASADGDDLTGEADEDGVVFPELIQQGESTDIAVTITGLGRLNAWIDWNGDGDFNDTGERVADNVLRLEGTENIEVSVPITAIISAPTFARFRLTPGTLSSPTGSGNGGEVEDYMINLSASPNAPTVPTGLTVDAVTENSVTISWNASSDNNGVTGYNVYRNGTLLASTSSSILTYTDNTVEIGNSYTYTVSAFNAAGYESDRSSSVTAEISDITPPSVPSWLTASATETSVNLSWDASTDNVGVTGYNLYRNGSLLTSTSSSTLTFTDNTVTVGNSYTYTVSAFDAAGNESDPSLGVTVSIEDETAPSVPGGLQVTSQTSTTVNLSWNASTDNVGVTGYNLYRNGSLLTSTSSSTLTFNDNTVTVGNSYNYTVSAFDAAGNESAPSAEVTVNIETTVDTEAPSVPTGLQVSSASASSITLSWNASTDNLGVTGYRIYRDNSLLETLSTSTSTLTYTDNAVTPGNTYVYTVSAFDAAGNESAPSPEVTAVTVDTAPPTTPAGLMALSASSSGMSLAWQASSDNLGVEGYTVFRGGHELETVSDTLITDRSVEVGHTYTYSVLAFDASGNESGESEPLTITITSAEYLMVSQLTIKPNPSGGEFQIEITEASGEFILEITASTGVLVAQEIINMEEQSATMTLNYRNLDAGIYYICIFNNQRIYYGKLMIIK